MKEGVRERLPKMAISTGTSQPKMPRGRGRPQGPGWAALDLKQHGQPGFGPEFVAKPFPPVTETRISSLPVNGFMNGHSSSAKSFLSAIKPSKESSNLMGYANDLKGQMLVGSSSGNKVVTDLEKLKELHNWADDCLIEDILTAVNNNLSQASTILQDMVSSGSSNESEGKSSVKDTVLDNIRDTTGKVITAENTTDLAVMKSALEERSYVDFSTENKPSDISVPVNVMAHQLIYAPLEPEWEEDDVYLSHRKDAIRTVRSAAQHSRAASNAFLRGDHYSAQKLSQKAQEEWLAAEKLNSKAAQEILKIRNDSNDEWKLDLHGLHTNEAVHALMEHLQKIETQTPLNRSVPRTIQPKADSPHDSGSCLNIDIKTDKAHGICSQRPGVLQVITGTGNHSRGGQASLPVAVRTFLIENGYRFDEARPGVIAVRPKFRVCHS